MSSLSYAKRFTAHPGQKKGCAIAEVALLRAVQLRGQVHHFYTASAVAEVLEAVLRENAGQLILRKSDVARLAIVAT